MMVIFEPGDRNTDISTIIQFKRYLWIYDQQEESGISLHLYLLAGQAEGGTFQTAAVCNSCAIIHFN